MRSVEDSVPGVQGPEAAGGGFSTATTMETAAEYNQPVGAVAPVGQASDAAAVHRHHADRHAGRPRPHRVRRGAGARFHKSACVRRLLNFVWVGLIAPTSLISLQMEPEAVYRLLVETLLINSQMLSSKITH
jgi:hypothetical protein